MNQKDPKDSPPVINFVGAWKELQEIEKDRCKIRFIIRGIRLSDLIYIPSYALS